MVRVCARQPNDEGKIKAVVPELWTKKIGARQWELLQDVEVFGVEIPAGYRFDGATVPRMFWWLLPPAAEGFASALVHDFRHTNPSMFVNRLDADNEFFENLGHEGIGYIRRLLIYIGVRAYAIWNGIDRL